VLIYWQKANQVEIIGQMNSTPECALHGVEETEEYLGTCPQQRGLAIMIFTDME
jgi:hypothetical protein